MPVSTYCWKDLLMAFVTGLPFSMEWKEDSYNSILIIIEWLIKMIYYKSVWVIIYTSSLAKVIINVVVRHHGLPDSIFIDQELLLTLKFWSLLCYLLGIKQKLYIAFYSQTDGQIKRQNSIIKAYIWAFVNFEQKIRHGFFLWRRLLITTPKMPSLATYLSSSIADIIFTFLIKKILTLAQNQEQ